jgi:hypothetical protein
MKCSQCESKVTMIGASACSLKCACELAGDNYNMVRARLANAVALAKMPCVRGTKSKQK